jgi:hypothetical protein
LKNGHHLEQPRALTDCKMTPLIVTRKRNGQRARTAREAYRHRRLAKISSQAASQYLLVDRSEDAARKERADDLFGGNRNWDAKIFLKSQP